MMKSVKQRMKTADVNVVLFDHTDVCMNNTAKTQDGFGPLSLIPKGDLTKFIL